MRLQRMTHEEYLQAKAEIERLKNEIKQLQERKKRLTDKVRWYDYSKDKLSTRYTSGFAVQHFGKRFKELTPAELKEYRRLQADRSRNRENYAKGGTKE